jgi:hypothetical protein
MADIQLALTDSLSRSGNGGMLAPFKVPDGSNINPSLSFVNEATSGLYRFGANDIRMAVGTTDRMRWQGAGTPPQIYDEENDRWNDLGAGGVDWRHAPTIPAEVEQGVGYMTRGGQSTLMPASPITGQAVTFSDLDNDWSETNFLTLDGNGNTFTQGSQTTYDLDLKGAFAQFAYLDGQWQIVNFGRLSDAYGFDLDDYATLALVNSKPNDNLLINGGFDIWQRGTIFNASGYTADRWDTGAGGATNQWKIQELAGANATKIRTTKWMNWVKTVVGQNTGNINQKIENVRTGGGSVVTLSFWAREVSNASKDFTVSATQVFGTGGDPDTSVFIGNYTIGGSAWTYYTFTFTLPEISNLAVIGANNHLKIQFSPVNAADTFNLGITAVKLEYGNTATAYQARPIGEELALCQRYYERIGQPIDNDFVISVAQAINGNVCYGDIQYQPKRIVPAISASNVGFTVSSADGLRYFTVNSQSQGNAGLDRAGWRWDYSSSIFIAGNAVKVDLRGSSIEIDAEIY